MAEQPLTPDEFDVYMDGLTIREQNQVLQVEADIHQKPGETHDAFNDKLKRMFLRLVWIAAWGWQVFTFGWPSALIIKALDKEFRKEKDAHDND